MSKNERDDVLNMLASRFFSAMLDDIVMDAALQSHQEEARNRTVCDICHTRCGQVHVPSAVGYAGVHNGAGSSRPATPAGDAKSGSTSSPSKDGNVVLDCVNCDRQVASNRYAAHLSGCMNLGTGTRRAATRTASSKPKLGSEAGRSASPYLDNGSISDDSPRIPPASFAKQPKPKGRPPKNRPKVPPADELVNPANHKRPGSPLSSPPKKAKKQKLSGPAISRVKSLGDSNPPLNTNQLLGLPSAKSRSNIPSRLRESSTSFLEPDPSTSPDSRSSSPGTVPVSAATPSSHTSETLKWNPPANGHGKSNGVGKEKKLPPRLPSPPRPRSPVIRRPETDYLVDVEGDETGSSTDTDSD
ncbi:hypothetical protein FA95DRAFT_1676574 [Auriscalpium vulgare]|uniref:Uncharacterized protein n=1 Tax=Auriscalpium vulgare TaxID=40419 RepID=A0ACB8S379_9AGAM|nr:hypothetical protein FA95DRAFT_1676574 [Auriscalpium vulgare]